MLPLRIIREIIDDLFTFAVGCGLPEGKFNRLLVHLTRPLNSCGANIADQPALAYHDARQKPQSQEQLAEVVTADALMVGDNSKIEEKAKKQR